MGATIRCSLFLWTSSFSLPFYLNVVPVPVSQRRCLARFRSESLGEVSHSDGHSVVNRQTKKPIHRDIKNRREHCSRFKMMFYVSALKFKDGTVCSSIHSLTVPKSIECRWRYFLLAYRRHWAVLHRIPNRNILYLVVAFFQKRFYYTKTLAENQVFSARDCINFVKVGYTNSLKTVNTNFKHKYRKFVRDFLLQNCPSCDRIKSEHNSLLFVC